MSAMLPAKALINGFHSNGNEEGESKSAAGIMFFLLLLLISFERPEFLL